MVDPVKGTEEVYDTEDKPGLKGFSGGVFPERNKERDKRHPREQVQIEHRESERYQYPGEDRRQIFK
jgi:hypothetical protein